MTQRRLLAAILLISPLLAAPYWPGCLPSHGSYPQPCSPAGSGNCSTDGWEQLTQVEQSLATADSTSVVHIGGLADWNVLEQCFEDQEGHPGTLVFSDEDIPLYCYRDLTWLGIWLRSFVAHQNANDPDCTGGRVGIINLAPIFSQANTLPDYLAHRRFTHADVLLNFKELWDAVLAELSAPAYELDDNDRAHFGISIGNEIGMYLNDRDQPYPRTGAAAPYPDPVTRWDEYRQFYEQAADYVRTTAENDVPVAVGTTVRWGEQPGFDGVCGPETLYHHANAGTDCTYNTGNGTATVLSSEADDIALTHLAMAGASDAFVYTRYHPHFLGESPSMSVSSLRSQFETELADDFAKMADWSTTATFLGATESDLPIAIQEMGYPTAWNDPNQNDLDDIAQNEIVEQQRALVLEGFQTWNEHNDNTSGAQIISFNWFHLHDFHTSFCDANTGGNYFPFCSWGLWTSDHQMKSTDSTETGWFGFAIMGQAQNPEEDDPPRACP